MNYFNTPKEIIHSNVDSAKARVNRLPLHTILLGILAGMFIAIGSEASNLAVHSITNVGTAKVIAGTIFPVGLIMIILVGGELFTGNCLLFMSVLDKQITLSKMFKQFALVYLGNFLGSFMIAALCFFSGQYNASSGLLGAYTLKVALNKVALTPVQAITSGILCNIIVCLAILMAGAAKDVTGKMLASYVPIFAFVISGFEHCVANMYYITAGLLCKTNPDYVNLALHQYGISQSSIDSFNALSSLKNFIPVTIGNIIGGAIIVGALLYYLNRERK